MALGTPPHRWPFSFSGGSGTKQRRDPYISQALTNAAHVPHQTHKQILAQEKEEQKKSAFKKTKNKKNNLKISEKKRRELVLTGLAKHFSLLALINDDLWQSNVNV